ncbi:hypothetical protein GCM10007984_25280 [Shewanella putrefaciens]|nr:hypothetical protein GCM10007984_25280 [Shewanella putrefaciens]
MPTLFYIFYKRSEFVSISKLRSRSTLNCDNYLQDMTKGVELAAGSCLKNLKWGGLEMEASEMAVPKIKALKLRH